VLLAVYHDAEEELRSAIATRGVLAADTTAGYVAATTLVGITRIALERMVVAGDDPVETLRASLDLLPGELVGDAATRGKAPARN
jgi:hypothetical protein